MFNKALNKHLVNCGTAQKMKFSIQDTEDLVTFTEEIYNGKLHFLCSVDKYKDRTFKRASYHFPNIPTSGGQERRRNFLH